MATRALITIVANKGGDSGEYNVKAYGATGDGVTNDRTAINTAITAAVASGGYLFFPQGTYKVSSNLTINCHVYFTKGAMLSIDNGVIVTITGNIEAKAFQIFSGSGTVSFVGNYVEKEAYPQWWGVVGDGATNNTTALNTCFTAADTGGIPVIFPKGTYNFDNTITIGSSIKLVDMSRATMAFTAATGTYVPAIVVGDSTVATRPSYNTYLGLNVDRTNISTWADEGDIGIQVYNANNCYFTDIKVYDFCIGLQCIAKPSASTDRGFSYNNIGLNIFSRCKVGVDLTNTADNGSYNGWVNQNIFNGGRFAGSTDASHNTLARYGIRLDHHVSSTYTGFNNNVFNNPCFEMGASVTSGEAIGILLGGGMTQNRFEGVRDEDNDYILKCIDTASLNIVSTAYGDGLISDTSSYKGSNIVRTTKTEYKKDSVIPVFQSGRLSEKAMYDGASVTLPAPIFYTRYNTITRGYGSSYLTLTSSGMGYSSGTLLGIGVRIDTSLHKSFSVSHDGTAVNYYFVCYDSNGAHIDADAGTYLWSLNPARSISKQTYFVSSGKCYYSQEVNSFDFKVHDDVKSVDIILAVDIGYTIQSFSILALDTTYASPVMDVYEPAGGWWQCNGTASPKKYWKSYKVNRKIWQAVTATGGYTGWTCVNQKDTTLTDGEPQAETVMKVGDSTSMLATDIVGVALDSGAIHWTTIASVDSGTQITLTDALPSVAAAGKAVYTNRWLGFGAIA